MKNKLKIHRLPALTGVLAVAGALALSACTTTTPSSPESSSSSAEQADVRVDENARAALNRLYDVAAGSRSLVQNAAGVLVFPKVVGGSLIVGAQRGQGVLLVNDRNAGYYTTTGASIGWQVGASSKTIIYVFNTQEALNKFRNSQGWQAGVDASVAIGRIGANGSIGSETFNKPVVAFIMNNQGVEGGVSLDGSKITRISAP